MSDKIYANKDILKWSRETVGINPEQAARKLHFNLDELIKIENGELPVSYSKLEKMAELYGRPLALFFFSRIPDEITPVKQFRTLPEIAFYEFDPNMYKLFRKALIMQINTAELNENKSIFTNVSIDVDNHNIKKSCDNIRNFLGVSLGLQKKKNDISESLEIWREAINNIGISVFKDSFQNDSYSGFSIYDDKFPIIFINNNLSKNRQLFTLFHELAHILFKISGIDIENDEEINKNINNRVDRDIEQFCNRFAAEFLVPTEDFVFEYQKLKSLYSEIDTANICAKLSKIYTVSKEVILRKLVDNKLVPINNYDILVNRWNEELESVPKKKPQGNFYYNKMSYLGKNYISSVFINYKQNKINATQASNYLMIKPRNFKEFALRFRGGL